MLEESEARRRLLEAAQPGAPVWVPVELALDQVASEPVEAILDSPPFDNSAMDGYAVRAAEARTGARLRVAGEEQPAGADRDLTLAPGEAIRIFTGAPLPAGADAVLMQEDARREGSSITLLAAAAPGENVRRRGGDVCAGQRLIERGEILTPARIGSLASQGIPEVAVHARPLVQIVTTGDELVAPGAPLARGEIYNSNAPMLQAAVARAGGIPACSHASDDPADLSSALEHALAAADLVLVAGGVSVGDHDHVKAVLARLGVETDFWRVRLKPGKPFLFGRHTDGTAVLGLPGNPVSAYVTFCLFAAPVIRRLLGHPADFGENGTGPGLGTLRGVAGEPLENAGDRPHYLRCTLRDGVLKLSGTQQSHAIHGLSRADCLLRLEPGERIAEGGIATAFAI